MRISTRVRYALRLMLDIARHASPDNEPVQLSQVAERNKLSKGYLEQLAVSLKNARLIRSSSGRTGGYKLAKPACHISLLDIFEASAGPINVVECVMHPDECMQVEFCKCRSLWQLINLKIIDVLADYTLEDLLDERGLKRMSRELRQLNDAQVRRADRRLRIDHAEMPDRRGAAKR